MFRLCSSLMMFCFCLWCSTMWIFLLFLTLFSCIPAWIYLTVWYCLCLFPDHCVSLIFSYSIFIYCMFFYFFHKYWKHFSRQGCTVLTVSIECTAELSTSQDHYRQTCSIPSGEVSSYKERICFTFYTSVTALTFKSQTETLLLNRLLILHECLVLHWCFDPVKYIWALIEYFYYYYLESFI